MRAALRIAWLCCTLFPAQRWLGIVALALTALLVTAATVAALRAGPAAAAAGFGAITLSIATAPAIFVLPALFSAGGALRYFSAPQSHALLPGFRRKLLGSIVLLAGTVVAFGWALVLVGELLAPESSGRSGNDVAVGWALLFVLALVSGAIYFTFLLMRISRWTIFLLLAAIVALQTLPSLGDRFEPVAGLPWMLMALLLAGWMLFGIWYLRVPRIAAPDLTGGALGAPGLRPRPGGIGRRASTELLLTGKGPFRLASTLAGLVLAGILLAGLFRWLFGVDWWVERPNNTLESSLATSIGLIGAMVFNTCGSRARYLWLLGSGRRAELFALLERAALKHAILFVMLIASVLVSMHFFFDGVGLDRVAVAVLLTLGFIPLAAYAGIARCRNFGLRDIGIVACVCLVFIVMHVSIVRGDWPFGAVVAGAVTLMVAAVALRAFVRRRWQSVDWLDYRVVRSGDTAFGLAARWSARDRT